ncbi:hypothetical protein LPJ64_004655 [Coemansia asiatica]|uniref:Uncharacterized protein n=1 Tax=Coemansia asiatica TaxID=1052880 RepID=A0A9W7XHX1_9FUNG|nr:hypothetical protein LPJ64_004655 [Coemansia asiatica]
MGQAKASGTAAKPPQASGSNSSSGPYIPLPESGETLLSYLDPTISFAQQIGVSSGPSVSAGAAAIDHPVNNNDWVADLTLFAPDGNSGTRVFSNVAGERFDNVDINRVAVDNQISNPTLIKVSEDSGVISNGNNDALNANQSSATPSASIVKRRGYEEVNDYSSSLVQVAPPAVLSLQLPAYHPAPPVETKPQVVEIPKYSPSAPVVEMPTYTPTVSAVESTSYSSASEVISATYAALSSVVSSTPVTLPATGYKKSSY